MSNNRSDGGIPMHVTTVCSLVYLFSGNVVCLPKSFSGPTKGKRSGYGGKQESGETIRECAIRETKEESGGIRVLELDKRGVVTFHWGSKQDVPGLSVERCTDVEVHVYRSDLWEGIPIATDVFSDPSFFPVDEIPYHEMMPCEELWFAQLLAGNEFTAEMHFRKCDGKIFCREGHLHKRARHDLFAKP
jgi:8-oxo-dGTP diphosphatase